MSIYGLNVIHYGEEKCMPIWMKFAIGLGEYLYDYGLHNKKNVNLIVSLPTEKYFSILVAIGIANKKFSINKQRRSIRKNFLNLEPGSRIIYLDDENSKKMSVISVEDSPIFEDEMILKVKDGSVERGIPERQWLDRVIILDEEYEEIKRTRKISDKQQLGLTNNEFLSQIYSHNQINRNTFFPGEYFYLVGNLIEIESWLNEEIFTVNGVTGSSKDFLYVDNNNSYTNGKIISSGLRKKEFETEDSSPVIFSNSHSYLRQKKHFINNPKIIINSRTDNESRTHEIMEELKRDYLQNNYSIITEDIIAYLKDSQIDIPNGIELIGWRF